MTATPAQISNTDRDFTSITGITSKVFPNMLDRYDLPQFVCHLYMAENDDPDAKNKYTIAKTGVTATQIDNISIKTFANGVAAGELTFVLTQPGHVSLIDDMIGAQRALGLNHTARPTLFLDIDFTGYSTDTDDDDLGGKIQHIVGPYRYKLVIGKIAISITAEGSTYDVSTMIHNYLGFTDRVFKCPAQFTLTGTTLETALESFKTQLLEYYKQNQKDYTYRDDYVFDLSDSSLDSYRSIAFTPNPDAKTQVTKNPEQEAEEKLHEGIEVNDTSVTIKENASFKMLVQVLLSLVEPFRKDMTRRININDPSSTEVDLNRAFVKWFNIISEVELGQYDEKRRDYARNYTYKVVILDTGRTDVDIPEASDFSDSKNLPALKSRFNAIIDRGLLRKAYYYIFTGKNDQITSLDIKFDNGECLFHQPTAANETKSALASGQASRILPTPPMDPPGTPPRPGFPPPVATELEGLPETEQVALAGQIPAEESPRRIVSQGWAIPQTVEGGTYYGFSNSIFGHMSYQYYLAGMGKSMINLSMTVRGDPWYMGRKPGELVDSYDLSNDPFSDPQAGCFLRDHTFFFLNLASPRFPDDNYDDEDRGTGYWNFGTGGGMIKSFSGLYLITQVNNTFSQGVFLSELQGILMVEFKVDQIEESVQKAQETASGSSGATDPATGEVIDTDAAFQQGEQILEKYKRWLESDTPPTESDKPDVVYRGR